MRSVRYFGQEIAQFQAFQTAAAYNLQRRGDLARNACPVRLRLTEPSLYSMTVKPEQGPRRRRSADNRLIANIYRGDAAQRQLTRAIHAELRPVTAVRDIDRPDSRRSTGGLYGHFLRLRKTWAQ